MLAILLGPPVASWGPPLAPEPALEMRGGGPPRPEPIVFAGRSGRDELEDEDTDDWDVAAGEPHVGEEGDAASAVIREDFASEDGDGSDVGGVDETDMDAVPSVRASTSADGDRGGI